MLVDVVGLSAGVLATCYHVVNDAHATILVNTFIHSGLAAADP